MATSRSRSLHVARLLAFHWTAWGLVGVGAVAASPVIGQAPDPIASAALGPPPPANDECSGAIAIAPNSTTNGTNVEATAETGLPTSCTGPEAGGAQDFTYAPGVWFVVQPPSNGTLVLDTFADPVANPFDTQLFVFSGSCGALACVTANDDARATPGRSRVAFQATASQDYFVLVSGAGAAEGDFVLTSELVTTPANDACANATALTGRTGSIAGTTVGATAEAFTSSPSSCAPDYAFFDVFNTYTACDDGTLTLDTCGGIDTVLSVHSSCPGLASGNQLASACNDDGAGGCAPGSSLSVLVTAGTTYWIRVTQAANTTASGSFTLTWSQTDTTAPSITTCAPDQGASANASCQAAVPDFTAATVATDACGTPTITQSPLAGVLVGLGVHTITITATDSAGNTATCSADFTVTDTTTPSITTCAPNQSTSANASCQAAVPDFTAATVATDACGTPTITQSPLAGVLVGLGVHTITITATDSAGNTATCSADFTVSDTTAPSITTCAPDQGASANASCQAAVPDFTAATVATDACGTPTITQSPLAGVLVGLGVHTITITATDGSGNTATCSADFTVTDTTAPSITTCAPNQGSSANASCQATVPDFTAATVATDACSTPTITQSPLAGALVGLGVHTITITATDGAGNTATCSADFTVTDTTAPSITTCAPDQGASANASCQAAVPDFTAATVATDACSTPTITQSPLAGVLVGLGVHTITITATDGAGNTATCSADFTVTDTTAPSITTCAPNQSTSANASCQAAVPDFTAATVATDACGTPTITQSPLAGVLVGLGVHTITITATDGAGNTATCSADFTVSDTTPPSITTCAPNQSTSANASCQAAVPDFTAATVATDACGTPTITQSPLAGVLVGLGVHTITITATDGAGNTATCSADFTVTDTTAPSITTCAPNQSTSANASCQAAVPDFTAATVATDACGTPTITQSPLAGVLVGLGVHTITITATDGAGNTATCSADFTVTDTTAPSITTCAPNQSTSANASCQAAVPDFTAATVATDACGTPTITQSPLAGVLVGLGVHTITITATDGAGNTATCSADFTVTDTTPPVVTTGSIAVCYANVAAAEAAAVAASSAVDACSVVPPPMVATVGACSATVTVTFTDAAGNTATAIYTTRIDATAPTITCPANVTYTSLVPAFVAVPVPLTSDDCSGSIVLTNSFNATSDASGVFPLGTTVVEWTATDSCGNASTCFHTVTVGAEAMRIAQVFGGGGLAGAAHRYDFVELVNAGTFTQDLAGWSVQLQSATGTGVWSVRTLPAANLAPGQHFLVRLGGSTVLAAGQVLELPTPDVTGTFDLGTTAGKVALVNDSIALSGADPASAAIVDFVGYGLTANAREPRAVGTTAQNAPALTVNTALFRLGCGALDTDVNADDFAVGVPTPRNTGVPAGSGVLAFVHAAPHFAEPGQTVRLAANLLDCSTSAALVGGSVEVDGSVIGGPAGLALLDDGFAPDSIAGDGIHTADVVVGAVASGTYHLPVSATNGPNTGASLCSVLVTPTAAPDNDHCSTAALIPTPYPASAPVALLGAHVEWNPILALGTAPTAAAMTTKRGVWYRVAGTGSTLTASLCASTADTVMLVLSGDCDGLQVVAQSDDSGPACLGSAASASWCSTVGVDYFVWVATFSTAPPTLATTLAITQGAPCTGASPTGGCVLDPGVMKFENEAQFGLGTNDGCDSSPRRFTPITVPIHPAPRIEVRGSARGYGLHRDSDWYRFVAPATDVLAVELVAQTGAACELVELGPGGTCPGTLLASSSLATMCERVAFQHGIVAGTSYALRVVAVNGNANTFGGEAVSGRSIAYELSARLGEPPENDSCANAISIDAPDVIQGSTRHATNDGTSTCDVSGRDVWYRFVLVTPTLVEIDAHGAGFDSVLSLHTACGAASIACNDDADGCFAPAPGASIGPTELAAGTWFVRVSDKGIGTGGEFTLRIVTIVNDDCCGAIQVACPSSTSGTTLGAALESAPVGGSACGGPGGGEGGQNLVVDSPGVWYRVTAPASGTLYADTLVASYDTSITVFGGACGALACVTANDDAQGAPFHSKVAWRATAGSQYWILVHGFGRSSTGAFTLAVTCDPSPPNDECSTATAIGGASGSIGGTLVGATGATSDLTSDALATCAPTHTLWDVWFAWTAPCSAPAMFETCGAFDTVLSVHSSCPVGLAGHQLPSACNNDGLSGCAPGSRVTFSATAGATYHIRVATAGPRTIADSGGGAAFTLAWSQSLVDTDGDLTPDCFDGCPLNPLVTAPSTFYPDGDGDGFGAGAGSVSCGGAGLVLVGGDCDDSNLAVYPDAFEVCNGVDDDCDTVIDEGLLLTFHPDVDGDGFGNPSSSVVSCSAPSGHVLNGADCNDGNTAVNPSATEVCNGIDDDCDTGIDEGVLLLFHLDADGDGFGDPDEPDLACTAPPGHVANALDCDDTAAAINPSASELCNGLDDDCDAGIDEGFDADGDLVADCFDNCPSVANSGQLDGDSDGDGDACDNCPATPNPLQQDCDGDMEGDACEGTPDCNGNTVPDACDITAATSLDVNSNGVPDECEGFVSFCAGDGSQILCPCGGNGSAGHGCANSTFSGGAILSATGSRSVAADTTVLASSHLTGSNCVFFQGTNSFPPVIVDDGLGCVGGTVIRLATKSIVANNASFPQGGDLLLSVRGAIPPAGATRYYQCFYRNAAAAFCPPATSNRTNGVAIVWIP